jgi:hypothetical protein
MRDDPSDRWSVIVFDCSVCCFDSRSESINDDAIVAQKLRPAIRMLLDDLNEFLL